jgi:hypothetical protein
VFSTPRATSCSKPGPALSTRRAGMHHEGVYREIVVPERIVYPAGCPKIWFYGSRMPRRRSRYHGGRIRSMLAKLRVGFNRLLTAIL